MFSRHKILQLIFNVDCNVYKKYMNKFIKNIEHSLIQTATPFEHCPVLHIDGFQLADSGAIIRYLSNKFDHVHLNGSNHLEAAKIEMIYQQIRDDWGKLPFFEKDLKLKVSWILSVILLLNCIKSYTFKV